MLMLSSDSQTQQWRQARKELYYDTEKSVKRAVKRCMTVALTKKVRKTP